MYELIEESQLPQHRTHWHMAQFCKANDINEPKILIVNFDSCSKIEINQGC